MKTTILLLLLLSVFHYGSTTKKTCCGCDQNSTSKAPAVVFDPEVMDGEVFIQAYSPGTEDCYDTNLFFQVQASVCPINIVKLGNNTYECAIQEADLEACGASLTLRSDRVSFVLQVQIVFEFISHGVVNRTHYEYFSFIKSRFTTAVTAVVSPEKDSCDHCKTVTEDSALVPASLFICGGANCSAPHPLFYAVGEKIYARCTVSIARVSIRIFSVALIEYNTTRELNLTSSYIVESIFEGGVTFSVALLECHACFLRVVGEIIRFDGTQHGGGGDSGSNFTTEGKVAEEGSKTAAHDNVYVLAEIDSADEVMHEEVPEENTALIIGLSILGGVVLLAIIIALAFVVASQRRRRRRSSQYAT